jgi:hypothetical protein
VRVVEGKKVATEQKKNKNEQANKTECRRTACSYFVHIYKRTKFFDTKHLMGTVGATFVGRSRLQEEGMHK